MNAPKLQLVRTREQTIEEALQALTNVMADTSIDAGARRACAARPKLRRKLGRLASVIGLSMSGTVRPV